MWVKGTLTPLGKLRNMIHWLLLISAESSPKIFDPKKDRMKKNVPQTRDWERLQIYRASSIFPVTRDTYHLFEAEAKKNWLTRIHLGIKHVDKKKNKKKGGRKGTGGGKIPTGRRILKKANHLCVRSKFVLHRSWLAIRLCFFIN